MIEDLKNPDVRPPLSHYFASAIIGVTVGVLWSDGVEELWFMLITIPAFIFILTTWDLVGYWRGYRQAYREAEKHHNLLERYELANQQIQQLRDELFGPSINQTIEDLPDEDEDLFTN